MIFGKLYIMIQILKIFTRSINEKKYKDNNINKFYLSDEYYNEGKFVDVTYSNIKKIIEEEKSFLLFVYNNYCNLQIPCQDIFSSAIKKYKIDILQIPFENFKKTNLYNTVKYAPTIIIIKNGQIVDYLNPDLKKDINKYQKVDDFEKWLNKYIIFNN